MLEVSLVEAMEKAAKTEGHVMNWGADSQEPEVQRVSLERKRGEQKGESEGL